MAFMTGVIGGHEDFTRTSAEPWTEHALGDIAKGSDGSFWMYVYAGEALAQYACCTVDPTTWAAIEADVTGTASARGEPCGVAPVAFSAGDFGWLQIKGVASVLALSSCAANAVVTSTATAGKVNDGATTGAEDIDGLVLTTAQVAASTQVACYLNFPVVGATN